MAQSGTSGSSRTARRNPLQSNDDPLDNDPADLRHFANGVIRLSEDAARTMIRLALAGIELLVKIDDWAAILGCSRREVEKLRAVGKISPPDEHVRGRCPGDGPRRRADGSRASATRSR